MKKILALFLLYCLFSVNLFAQYIIVSGNKFTVDGKEIYLNGVNAPWQWQSDCDINFMRHNFDRNFWDTELQKYADNKVNVVRVWLHGSGNYSPALDGNGYVTPYGNNDIFWQNMDTLVNIAARKKIYLMLTFWSFDMASTNAWYYSQYRQILTDDNRAGSYLNNFLIPFVQRYKNNNWIMGYDLCNEPEHIWRDANCGNLSAYWVTRFLARCAVAVHQNCSQPVTVGSMWAVYNSNMLGNGDGDAQAGFNRYSDVNIKNYFNDINAYLDFYSPHWYQWQGSNGPFNRTVLQWIGADDKPVITGETYGGDLSFITMADFYTNSYINGFDGTMGWKNACQNDGYGTWNGVKSGTLNFYNQYPDLVYPIPLPVTYSSFKAIRIKEGIEIVWTVTNEIFMQQYVLEQSLDGIHFVQLNATLSTGQNTYRLMDNNPSAEINYYRLKGISFNGNNYYSEVKEVAASVSTEYVNIYPNPINYEEQITIQFVNEVAGKYKIRLYNCLGQTVLQKTLNKPEGWFTYLVNLPEQIITGYYQLEIVSESGMRTIQKIMID